MYSKIFHAIIWTIIIGNLMLLGLLAFWLFYPYKTTYLKQPIEILNPNNEIRIGDPIVMKLEVNKPNESQPISERFIVCEDGNLVTLATSSVNLPAGTYVVINDKTLLPPKVALDAKCKIQIVNTYRLNPVRTETVIWESEYFITKAKG